MRLSEAILLGSTTAPPLNNTSWKTCLIGIGMHALGKDNIGNHEAMLRYPWLREDYEMPAHLFAGSGRGRKLTARQIITGLATQIECGSISLEQAVDWIRSVEPEEPANAAVTGEREAEAVGSRKDFS